MDQVSPAGALAADAAARPGPRPVAIALIDGEHYPPVVLDTLRALADRYELVAALFLGGEEKLRDRQAEELDELYGLPVTPGERRAWPPCARHSAACLAPARGLSLTCPTSRC